MRVRQAGSWIDVRRAFGRSHCPTHGSDQPWMIYWPVGTRNSGFAKTIFLHPIEIGSVAGRCIAITNFDMI
jgi:hypothetical protein